MVAPRPLEALVSALARVQAALAAGDALAAAAAMAEALEAARGAQHQGEALGPLSAQASQLLEACAAGAAALDSQLRASMEELSVSSRAHSAYRAAR